MLPFFKIIGGDNMQQHQQHDIPVKPKRNRKIEVPVHKSDSRKKCGANADAIKCSPTKVQIHQNPDELIETSSRISRRILSRENERLLNANQELVNAQDHLSKKNCKLKEKLNQVIGANEELANEINLFKAQYESLAVQFAQYRNEMEKPKVCATCLDLNDSLEQTKREYAALKKSNQEYLEDCNMLKNVIYRLNMQLERYQQKLQTNNLPTSQESEGEIIALGDGHYGHKHSPITWGKVNAHTLAPLLNAYQETIAEKEEIIESYETEMVRFTGKLKEVIKENENLYTKLTEDSECSKVLSTQIDQLKDELKTTKDQNDLLIKKCALKQDKIEEILKCYEQKERDYAVLHDQYCKCKSEVAVIKEKNKSLVDAQDDFKNERNQYIPITVHNASVNECKKWYEELKIQYENEKTKLRECIDQLKEQINEFNLKISAMNVEKAEGEQKLKNFEKHMKKAETKYLELEHTLNEVQLSRSACRKQLHKAMNFAKDLVTEQESLLKALNQRQLENKAVKKIGSDIASRMDILRNELKSVQKEAWHELSTVEERLQEQDCIITNMKEDHELEVQRLKQIIREKDNNLLVRDRSSVTSGNYLLHNDRNVHK
ncbi:PREDICTED: protein Cep89 homolog [Nicrophorus vespilloides]|uniref:Protein Cep89 homolog n=1 Tax=Nicrophorus vespilloides TaxID=110193 RepID=A0ABM1NB90_NICVS|nr:PREDICTED: protein Cep89 homolog [Nicrophorus vespilloides]